MRKVDTGKVQVKEGEGCWNQASVTAPEEERRQVKKDARRRVRTIVMAP